MKKRSFAAQLSAGLLLAMATLALTSCANKIYYYPEYPYAGRPIPPSGLLQRVLASYTSNGSSGGLEILDGLRDIRSNVQNTIPAFFIAGYSSPNPVEILNFPEQTRGLVRSMADGSFVAVNYSSERQIGTVGNYGTNSPSATAAPDLERYVGVNINSSQIIISVPTGIYALTIPNVDKVVMNGGDTVILAMVRNSNALYRIIQLSSTPTPTVPPGAVDCEPLLLPVYCAVPVPGTYDRPVDAYFSLDGTSVDILNCGPECGGNTAGVSVLSAAALNINLIPASLPYPSPMLSLGVPNPVPVPGGVTTALSDGTLLYLAGQQLQPDGLFAGNLSTINLASYAVTGTYSIADGHHSKLLFGDDNTLWSASQQCASGERAAHGLNYNCLTMIQLGPTLTPTIIPNVTPGGPVTVPYPNNDNNLYYYGSATGLCWVQGVHKMYTAYGGQIHAFYTGTTAPAGTEINNFNITIQGTVLDVAYMDADTNTAD